MNSVHWSIAKGRSQIILWGLTCLFVFVLPLSQFLSVRLLLVTMIFSFFVPADHSFQRFLRSSWDLVIYIVVLGVGLLYTSNLSDGYKTLETSFSLLAMPILFSKLSDFSKEKAYILFSYFIAGLFVACIVCVSVAVINYTDSSDVHVFFFEKLTEVIGMQPTYLAYYLILAITVGTYLMFYNEGRIPRTLLAVTIVCFFCVLMLSGGRTAFISLILNFSFYFLKYLLEPRNIVRHAVFALICFMLLSLFVVNSMPLWTDFELLQNDYWERSMLWKSAVNANSNILIGVGTGDYKAVLNEYYLTNGLSQFATDSYNAHNQFIQITLSNGLLGLLGLLLIIVRPIYLSISSDDTLGKLLLFPFLIYGVTEVFLGRYQGVVLFAFLHQVVISRHYFGKPVISLRVE